MAGEDHSDGNRRSSGSRWPLRVLTWCQSRLVVLAGVATVLGLLGALWWPFDLLAHFRAQYFGLLAFACAVYLGLRRWRWAGVAATLAVVNAALVLPDCLVGAPNPAAPGAHPLTLLFANVNGGNTDASALLDAVRDYDPDLVVVLEVTPHWEVALATGLAGYPHRLVKARADMFGIGLYSRPELREPELVYQPGDDIPAVRATVEQPGGPIHILAAHVVPPIGGEWSNRRDAQLEALARTAKALGPATALVGDFNATPWSRAFAPLRAAGLSDTRQGFGYQGTWPAMFPPLLIPIDHCLTGPGLRAVFREVGPDIGSDHYPVIVRLVVSP